jgi:hypothetical protein
MSTPASTLSTRFYVVRLDLAREPGHPAGSARDRYTLVLPLGEDGRIVGDTAKAHPELCRVSHADESGELRHGRMRLDEDGAWTLEFDEPGEAPEVGFRFGQEQFQPGEYVSILRDDEEHTYRVVSLIPA